MKTVYEKGNEAYRSTLYRSLVSVAFRFGSKFQGVSKYYFSESTIFLRVRSDRHTANREVG